MALEIVGLVIVTLHLIVVAGLILWLGLGMPTTAEKFRTRFKTQFLGTGKK